MLINNYIIFIYKLILFRHIFLIKKKLFLYIYYYYCNININYQSLF